MILPIVLILIVCLFLFVKKQYSHWESVGIPFIKPEIPFGNIRSVTEKKRSFGTAIYDLYTQTTEPFIGIYLFFRPAILINDRELVKNVLTKEFQHFHDRGVYCEPKSDPMSANLFALPGDAWKTIRTSLTPAFTSGKLKGMFPQVNNVGQVLVDLMKPLAEKNEAVDIFDLTGRYVVDCLASVAFGQDGISSLKDPNHEFRTTGTRVNDNTNFIEVIRGAAVFVCPKLLKIFHMKSLPTFVNKFCINMVTKTIEEREQNNVVKKDLMQYLIQLRNDNDNKADDEWKINASGIKKKVKNMSYEEIAAQVFVFYIAGSESSSATVSYTLFELTQNEELMRQAQEDISSTLEKHDGELTYESIMDMKFIDLCVKETLRKYPALPILNRECTKDYQVPGTNFTIQKGTSVIVSLLGIHRNAEFFPEPEKYNPDRFTDEKRAYDEDMYMPFGAGPRNCIAYRMGLLMTKTAIVMLLKNYNFKAIGKQEIAFDFGTVALSPMPGSCKIRIMKKTN